MMSDRVVDTVTRPTREVTYKNRDGSELSFADMIAIGRSSRL